ncbi:MAG: rhomboid family intramembrane serine protease [Chitinophagaceae bacterium]|nr:MAG: rhomboid family intramembrane serine protease [Chitinophagaceae bacterium]
MELSITIVIIIITVLVSIGAFNNEKTMDELIFYPPAVTNRNQWYRFFSCGLIHADWGHLIFNMLALYLFGQKVELYFAEIFGTTGKILYLVMYITALAVSVLPTYFKHKDDYHYRSLGASGAVSAVVFAGILFDPISGIGLFFIPIYVAGFIFGFIYLLITSYLDKKGGDRINHSAHLWGAFYGIAFTILVARIFSDYAVVAGFLNQIRNTDPSDFIKFGGSAF